MRGNRIGLSAAALRRVVLESLSTYAAPMHSAGPRFDELRTVIDTINSAVTDIGTNSRPYSFQDARWALPAVWDRIGDATEVEIALQELLPGVSVDAREFILVDFERWRKRLS